MRKTATVVLIILIPVLALGAQAAGNWSTDTLS